MFLDADGVLFSGHEYRGGGGVVLKKRSYIDGQGLSLLRAAGIRIVCITGESVPLLDIAEKMNALPSAVSGAWLPVEAYVRVSSAEEKARTVEEVAGKHGVALAETAYVGDDLNDFLAMQRVARAGGVVAAPLNATRRITEIATVRLTRSGGDGALREFAEMILDARGIDERNLSVV